MDVRIWDKGDRLGRVETGGDGWSRVGTGGDQCREQPTRAASDGREMTGEQVLHKNNFWRQMR